jgi:two-component system, OmpR family, sensor histidine kinase KdpD
MPHNRPDPEALLRRVQEQEARARRGQLKVFLGASPGVGKTFTMLEAARAKRADGLDVVVGLVETHGRAETARLLEGLETIPRRSVEYRGTRLEEFDLDAALARRPAILLVDELAHSNVPGSRHAKRWQDIEELLAAGINVYTTVNIQHLESLSDIVAQITGVQVRETVPDSILERADEVELVDVTADVLQQRLREGKVYVPEQATRAIERFFRRGNLIALRELALRRTAERVDEQMRGYMAEQGIRETWAAADRLLVCLGPDPSASRLVRATRRMATRLHADWVAVHVETVRDRRLSPEQREDLLRALELAEELGGRTVTLSGYNEAEEILAYARAHNVTTIVVGKPGRSRWREVLRGSLLDALVRGSGPIEVLTLTGDEEAEQHDAAPARPSSPLVEYLKAAAVVLVPTALGLLLRWTGVDVPTIDMAMLYLLSVVVTASRYRRGPSVVAALVGIASFDFFFVPPFYTFAVSDVRYLLTFGVMLLVALVMGSLTARIREQVGAARDREQRFATLYGLSRDLASVRNAEDVTAVALRNVRDTFPGEAAMFLPDSAGRVEPGMPVRYPYDDHERTVAQWVFDHGMAAGLGTTTLPAAAAMYLPLIASSNTVGVLGIRPANIEEFRDPARRRLLEALAGQTALALERLALAERSRQTEVEVGAERLRTALLSSLSHDMRTPLASIEGSASTLLHESGPANDTVRKELLSTILQESQRMGRLVANLLDMIRVETGALQVQKDWQLLSDVVGVALLRTEDRMKDHPVTSRLFPDLPLVPVDEILLEQVFVNLLENAAKYTPPGTPVEIGAEAGKGELVVYVADRGPGIASGDEEKVFDKFHRGGAGSGIGLGLTICRGIITAHGGRIWAENRPDGGAVFRFTLPITGTPPTLGEEAADGQPQEHEVGSPWTASRRSSS